MSKQIRKKTNNKDKIRKKHHRRIRDRIIGTEDSPRLGVFRSNHHLYVQVIDDSKGVTLASASTNEAENRGKVSKNLEGAKNLGNMIAKRALAKNISKVVFDRGGYLFHGRIRALAEGAREGGLKF